MPNQIINPSELVKPVGYAHAVATTGGKTIYLAGQVSFDQQGNVVYVGDMVKQFEQALKNLQITMRAAGGEMTDIVKLNLFVKSRDMYRDNLKEIGGVYRSYFGKHFMAMTLVEVSSLFEDEVLLEIEGIAVIDR